MRKALQDKVIAVSGAGRGIGREIALLCARLGASVVVNDIGTSIEGEGKDEAPAMEVVNEIRAAGGQAVASTDSVSSWPSASRIIQQAVDTFGRIDGVVNNAGILRDRMFHKMTVDDWTSVLDVHLSGAFYMSRAAATHFREQESGALVQFTSTTGLVGNFGQCSYAAAKAGMVGLSKSIAMDMHRFNVRSNCVSPFAWSRMVGSVPTDTPEQQARIEKVKSMSAAKIAPLVAYLLSDGAKDVTAQIFAVRSNEIFLMSQSRPLRSVHRGEGWTVDSIGDHAIPALRSHFYGLDRTQDVFTWDPI